MQAPDPVMPTTRHFAPFLAAGYLLAMPLVVHADDWPWWRGPQRNGVAAGVQMPPLEFSASRNVRWAAPVPGRGHGSPTVAGDSVYLATADEKQQTQSVLCYDRKTGSLRWQTEVHEGGFPEKMNPRATQASGTVACDGERLFISFFNRDAVYTTAIDLEGKQLWQTKITDYIVHQGFGSSPAVYESLVIVSADNKDGGRICGLDRTDGKVVWKVERPKLPNYASPIILKVAGHDQLLFSGCDLVSSFDPLTGEKLWETEGSTTECVTSIVTDGERVFTSGGYPKNHVSAVTAVGTAKIVWENDRRVYVPSMLVKDGFLYAIVEPGLAVCWKSDTGERRWRSRLGGNFWSSPVLVGDRIYAANEAGRVFIFKADPRKFELLAENQLGEESFATPAICDGEIFHRVAVYEDGERREKLYCIGGDS